MEIIYLNHSSFLIKTKFEGNKLTRIVTDPFSPEIGIKYPSTEADIVLVSHNHYDHFYMDGIKGLSEELALNDSHKAREDKPFIISTPGQFEVRGIHIKGIKSYHDSKKGEERGTNTIYVISNEGYKVCFLGDLGHVLSDSQVEEIGEIDLLIVPVGGVFSIDPETASEVISQIEPGHVIPMHYKTSKHVSAFEELKTLQDFMQTMGVEKNVKDSFTLSKSLEEETEVVVLKPQYDS